MKEEVRLVAMSTQKRRERNVRHRNSHSVSKVGAEHVVVGIGWFPEKSAIDEWIGWKEDELGDYKDYRFNGWHTCSVRSDKSATEISLI